MSSEVPTRPERRFQKRQRLLQSWRGTLRGSSLGGPCTCSPVGGRVPPARTRVFARTSNGRGSAVEMKSARVSSSNRSESRLALPQGLQKMNDCGNAPVVCPLVVRGSEEREVSNLSESLSPMSGFGERSQCRLPITLILWGVACPRRVTCQSRYSEAASDFDARSRDGPDTGRVHGTTCTDIFPSRY